MTQLLRRTPGTHWPAHTPPFATDTVTVRRVLSALRRRHFEELMTDPDAYPIDFPTITRSVELALARRLALPDPAWVAVTTRKLRGHLELLLSDDLFSAVDTPQSRALRTEARRLLDRHTQPRTHTPPGHAYDHMRSLAEVTRVIAAACQLAMTARAKDTP